MKINQMLLISNLCFKHMNKIIYIIILFFIGSTHIYAADVITNGTFDTDITTGWTNSSSGSGSLTWNSFNGGSVQGLTGNGSNILFSFVLEQSIGTINSTDNVFLSLYWYKWSEAIQAANNSIVVKIIKPSGDSVEIWSDLTIPSTNSSLSGNVTTSDISSFFDISGTYTLKIVSDLESGTDINAFAQSNLDNIVLDVQPATSNQPPVVTDIPNQTISEGGTFTSIALDNYVSDPDNSDAELTWTYTGNTELSINLTNRYVFITAPSSDWNGAETITFRATDPLGLWSEDPATFTVTPQNDAPTLVNSITNVSVSPVNRLNANTTIISANFTDVDQPAANSFNITFKIREPNNTTELILVNNLTNGNGGLTVVDNSGGSYTASYTYDPSDIQTLGLYDLYFEVSDGTASVIDDFNSNPDELEINEVFTNAAPIITLSATSVSPTSIDRAGANSTIFTIPFTDADIPAVTSFLITIKVRAPYNETILPLIENSTDGQNGLTITDNGGGSFTATFSWDPVDNITVGYYDIQTIISDGTASDTDFFADNLDELLISNGGENSPPIIASDASYATPAGVEPIGTNLTTIGAQFLDSDLPGVNAFTINIKLREPDNSTEILLATDATNGTQGITITDEGSGVYRVETSWDPSDLQALGFYDIYISVSDGSATSTDDYANNSDELELYSAITNSLPTVISGATSVTPISVNRIGSEFTTISVDFSDADYPGTGAFSVTIKLREPDNSTEIIVTNAAKHKEQGLRIQHISGTTYRASVLWNPADIQSTGTYDLYFYVEDNFAASATDDFANNLDELTVTSAAILGDGNILKRTNNSNNCGGTASACHNLLDHQGQNCLVCHSSHDVTNIYLVNDTIQTPNSGLMEVIFKTLGIGDPYNTPDPTVGDPTSGVMADATDGVSTGVCEVCHTTTAHHRNDGSQLPDSHHDSDNCTQCHLHTEGFKAGESNGGMACSCHEQIFIAMDSTSLLTRHILADNAADYSPGASGMFTIKNCLTCHVDHDIFRPDLNTGIGTRGSNLRVDWAIDPVSGDNTVLLNSDYQSTGNGGICLSCHTDPDPSCSACHSAHISPGKQQLNNATASSAHGVIHKTEYDAATSGHNYSVPTTFATDGSVFNANCTKCHNDDMLKTYQNSTIKVSVHGSSFALFLDSTGIASPTSPLEENLCFKCHSTTSNPNAGSNLDFFSAKSMTNTALDIESKFSYTYSHQIGNYSGIHTPLEDLSTTARHVECEDCHNVHESIQGTHDGSSQLVSNTLKGAIGVEPTSWPARPTPTDNANVFAAPTGYSVLRPAQNEYQICLKCHSNYTTLPTGSPNIAEEINPNYPSTHGITIANQNPYCNSTTMYEPWGSSGSNYCSDCHRSDNSADPEGPHGSNAEHLLVASIVSSSTVGTPLCNVCHRSSVYWSGSSSSSRFSQHPSSRSAHRSSQGCFTCHMWDYASTAGLGVPTDSWSGGAPLATTNLYVHGQNKIWNFRDRDGSAGSGQDVDAFCNGYLSNIDYVNKQCWTETCRTHSGYGY